MPVGFNRFSRRQFLVGAGGYSILIPFLPSLMSREAQAAATTNPRRLMIMNYDHNIMASENIQPNVATNVVSTAVKNIALSSYKGSMGNFLTNTNMMSIKNSGLMTIVRGIDSLTTPDAHGSTWLTAGNINGGDAGVALSPSLDSYMEASPTLYPSTQSYFKKILRCNGSYSFQKVGTKVAHINDCYQEDDPNDWNGAKSLYQDMVGLLNGGSTPVTPTAGIQGPILNKVYAAFLNVKNGRKISSDDKARLDNHMQLLSELEGSFLGTTAPIQPLNCSNPITDKNQPAAAFNSYTDKMIIYFKLIAMALSCGLTKVAILNTESNGGYNIGTGNAIFPSGGVAFHNGVVHNEHGYSLADQQSLYSYWLKWHFDKLSDLVLAPLQATQDPLNSNGKSILENMLVVAQSEAGVNVNPGAHINLDYQPIMFGNMGGLIKSDQLVVYDRTSSFYRGAGVAANAFMITLLQAMGLSESEYVAGSTDASGFGVYPKAGSATYFDRSRFYVPIKEIWRG
jgi:hypothetical protein